MTEASGTLTEWSYFVWVIKNFAAIKQMDWYVTVCSMQVKLSLSQNCFKNTEEDCFELFLECKPEVSLEFHTTVYLKDALESCQFSHSRLVKLANYSTMTQRKCVIWTVERRALLANYEALVHPDGTVHIVIVTGSGKGIIQEQQHKKAHKSVQVSLIFEDVPCLESLSLDLRRYLVAGEPDVVITCGDKNVKFHKAFLVARSRVFAEMLHNKMSEKQKLTIFIRDMKPSVLIQFLRYIQCGRLPRLTKDSARDLYVAGCKYAIEPLRKKCSNFLFKNLSEENAPSLLLLSDSHKDRYFKNNIVSFITKNDKILRGETWTNFSENNKMLAFDVYQAYFKPCSSKRSTC